MIRLWRKKQRHTGIPADQTDPRVLLERLVAQRPKVESIARALKDRGDDNGFGDEVTLTFTPRRSPTNDRAYPAAPTPRTR